MNYIDLVAVNLLDNPAAKNKLYLFMAPPFSHLASGQEVYVDTMYGEKRGVVVQSYTANKNLSDNEDKMIIAFSGATLPLKRVIAKCVRLEMDYADYEKEEVENYEQEKSETE